MTGALYIAHARIQKVLTEGVQFCNVFYGRIKIPLYKRAIISPPVKCHLNGVSLACPDDDSTLNACLVALSFSGIRTDIAKKPYIFVIFQAGGGGVPCPPLDPPMFSP